MFVCWDNANDCNKMIEHNSFKQWIVDNFALKNLCVINTQVVILTISIVIILSNCINFLFFYSPGLI